jgi:hypothetical protein
MFKSVYFPLLSFALIIGAIYMSFERQLPHYQSGYSMLIPEDVLYRSCFDSSEENF